VEQRIENKTNFSKQTFPLKYANLFGAPKKYASALILSFIIIFYLKVTPVCDHFFESYSTPCQILSFPYVGILALNYNLSIVTYGKI
jgi:hypothetical protein